MGTNSHIGVMPNGGSIRGIYCHWDGFTESVGATLRKHYDTFEKVEALLALGNISSLGKELGEKHKFDEYIKDVCTAYGRDRGKDDQEAQIYKDLKDFCEKEYNYVFDGVWNCYNSNGKKLPW